jgi:hypothetical protein
VAFIEGECRVGVNECPGDGSDDRERGFPKLALRASKQRPPANLE